MNRVFAAIGLVIGMMATAGCSTLDLSLWPASFPLFATKALAERSPKPNALAKELDKQTVSDYFVEPGDRILVEATSLNSDFQAIGDQKIQIDGSIDLGRFGRLRVAGLTVESIEYAIEERLREITGKPEAINVQLVESNSAEVYVLGEVGSPGAYAIDGHETVLDAILVAGGLTSRASPCDIVLVRPTSPGQCRVVLPICYRQLTQIGDVSTNYQVQPGDRIVVAPRTFSEELAFWNQTSSCPRCACRQCIECSPENVTYSNRFMNALRHFPLPRKFEATSPQSNGNETNSDDTLPSMNREEAPPSVDENRVFLEPLSSLPRHSSSRR